MKINELYIRGFLVTHGEDEEEEFIKTSVKNQEDAEKLDEHMRNYHSCGYGCQESERVWSIVERLKKFFNGDNVLTKSEYKQKILEEEKDV